MATEIIRYAYYPSPAAEHALGLLYCELDGELSGQRCTIMVQAEWLRTVIPESSGGWPSGFEPPAEWGGFDVPPECVLPEIIYEWPDDWPSDSPHLRRIDALARSLERISFAKLRAVLDPHGLINEDQHRLADGTIVSKVWTAEGEP